MQPIAGQLRKLTSTLSQPVLYQLPIHCHEGEEKRIELNASIGKTIEIHADGQIFCIYCGRKTTKSFNQGYCYPCFRRLARNDQCILHPEKCHFHLGTCREEDWGQANCMQPHIVYLAQTSSLKVGITRQSQIPTRWIDQGAIVAMPIVRVANRLQSGLVEVALKSFVNDKTNWREMLKHQHGLMDLNEEWESLKSKISGEISILQQRIGLNHLELLTQQIPTKISYPIIATPKQIKAIDLEKTPVIAGQLLGIKGQYLLFEEGVLNIRKYAGYQVSLIL